MTTIAYWKERAEIAEAEMVLARKERREIMRVAAKLAAVLDGVNCGMCNCIAIKKGRDAYAKLKGGGK